MSNFPKWQNFGFSGQNVQKAHLISIYVGGKNPIQSVSLELIHYHDLFFVLNLRFHTNICSTLQAFGQTCVRWFFLASLYCMLYFRSHLIDNVHYKIFIQICDILLFRQKTAYKLRSIGMRHVARQWYCTLYTVVYTK